MSDNEINEIASSDDIKIVTAFDLGWLIGIIDGVGCFILNKVKSGRDGVAYNAKIRITNTNLKIINKIEDILTRLYINYQIAIDNKNLKTKTCYIVIVQGYRNLNRFLTILISKFICRKTQAGLLYDYVKLRLSKKSHSPLSSDEYRIAKELSLANQVGI